MISVTTLTPDTPDIVVRLCCDNRLITLLYLHYLWGAEKWKWFGPCTNLSCLLRTMGPNDPNEDSGWGQTLEPVARDGTRAETRDTQTEKRGERGTFWMKTNVKTIKAIFPLINSPLWLLGLLSLSVPIQLQMDERLGVSGCNWIWIRWPRKHQDWCTMSLMESDRKKKKTSVNIKVWKYWMNVRLRGDNWQIVFTNDKISWSKVAFSIQFAVYFSFEIWQKMTNRIWNTIFVLVNIDIFSDWKCVFGWFLVSWVSFIFKYSQD